MIEALNWHPDFSTPTTSMSLARKIDEIISKVNELEAKLQCASQIADSMEAARKPRKGKHGTGNFLYRQGN